MVSKAKKSHAKAHKRGRRIGPNQRSRQHRQRQSSTHGHSTSSFTKYMRVYKKGGPRLSAYRKRSAKQNNREAAAAKMHRDIVAAYKEGGKINGKKVMHYVTKKGTSVYRRYKPAGAGTKKKKKTSPKKKKKKTSPKKKKKKTSPKKKQSSGRRRSTRSRKKPNRLGY